MKKSKFTEEQIAFALRQAESETRVAEVCRKMGIALKGEQNNIYVPLQTALKASKLDPIEALRHD